MQEGEEGEGEEGAFGPTLFGSGEERGVSRRRRRGEGGPERTRRLTPPEPSISDTPGTLRSEIQNRRKARRSPR